MKTWLERLNWWNIKGNPEQVLKDEQVAEMCQFASSIKDENTLYKLYEMAAFKILEMYAEIEVKAISDTDKLNMVCNEDFKNNLTKYILIIEAIKKILKNRKNEK